MMDRQGSAPILPPPRPWSSFFRSSSFIACPEIAAPLSLGPPAPNHERFSFSFSPCHHTPIHRGDVYSLTYHFRIQTNITKSFNYLSSQCRIFATIFAPVPPVWAGKAPRRGGPWWGLCSPILAGGKEFDSIHSIHNSRECE